MTQVNSYAGAASPTSVRWRIVAILMSFTCMNHFNRIAMAVAKESVQQDFDLSDVQMGTVFSSFLLAYTLCMTPGGWLADRFGPRKALLLMGFGTAAFVALTSVSGYGLLAAGLALPSLVLIRTLMGALTSPL